MVLTMKISYVRVLISLMTNLDWPLYQLDVKNAFLHGDLLEEVYMEQPPRFVAEGQYRAVSISWRKHYMVSSSHQECGLGSFLTL
jgi:hypothetical protein